MTHASTNHVFHRQSRVAYPKAIGGEGAYLVDESGKRYLDASGGAAVSCLGHGHPMVVRAIQEQAARLAYAHTSFFTNDPLEELARELAAVAPPGLERAFIVNGGSEAMEAALKLARQYFLERREPDRTHFIGRRQSYHGSTLGALSISGNLARRKAFGPYLFAVTHIAPCYPYRDQRPDESDEAYGQRIADELETAVQEVGPKRVAAFVAETVAGATLGAVPPVEGYFARIRKICDRHGILLILDEVMCGMGRTGTSFACEQEGIAPDIAIIAKGLGGGYQPIGAMLASEPIHTAIRDGSGSFQHGHTYLGHPIACAAALAVQRVVREQDLLANVRRSGDLLRAALEERFGNHRHVGDIRGRGLLLALELVAERGTKQPFSPRHEVARRIREEALTRGLICYPMGGVIDGERGDHVMVAPPYIVGDREITEIVERLGDAVDAAVGNIDVPTHS
jgi:adenosylmethionine-8-amino-7-oxononanoate aminotransferase